MALEASAVLFCRPSMNHPPTALVGFGEARREAFVG
jgi:hypothetical protein